MASIPEFGQELTPRESEVLSAFCDGFGTQKEVARYLHISHRTVEKHMQNAMVKMGAGTQQQAVLMWDRASCAGPAGALRIAMQEALASLEVGMVGGAADTLRRALAAHAAVAVERECCNAECGWTGNTSRMLGSVGPLCPDCGEVTEAA